MISDRVNDDLTGNMPADFGVQSETGNCCQMSSRAIPGEYDFSIGTTEFIDVCSHPVGDCQAVVLGGGEGVFRRKSIINCDNCASASLAK